MLDITVCLITCGEDTESDCAKALEECRDRFAFSEVRHVYPQAAANNAMLQSAHTKYLVPVDSDMILYPGWSRIIEQAILDHLADSWYQILFPLWDTLMFRRIGALKVLRTDIMSKIAYEDVRVSDLPHFQRMKEAGYHVIDLINSGFLPIGRHVVRGSRTCYLKFKDAMICRHLYDWHFNGSAKSFAIKEYNLLVKLHQKTGNPDYLYCIAGLADGWTSQEHLSKNHTETMKLTVDEGLVVMHKLTGTLFL